MSGRRITRLDSPGRHGFTVMIGLLFLSLPIVAADAFHARRHARGSRPVPTPTIRTEPSKRTTETSARFTFTDKERRVAFVCSLDGSRFKPCLGTQRYGPSVTVTRCAKHADYERSRSERTHAKPCTSTKKFTGSPLSLGAHTFRVRARVRTGGLSRAAAYTWTIEAPATAASAVPSLPSPPPTPAAPAPSPPSPGEGHRFSISTAGSGGELYPGGPPEAIPLTLSNPNDEPLYVTSLAVAVSKSPAGCEAAANLRLTQSSASAEAPVILPANGSVTLPVQGVSAPTLQLLELPSNQDACKGVIFKLSYTGNAHS
jgi:hypothetical protein